MLKCCKLPEYRRAQAKRDSRNGAEHRGSQQWKSQGAEGQPSSRGGSGFGRGKIHPAGRPSGRAVGPGRNELGNQVAMNRFSEGSEPGNRGCRTSSWNGRSRFAGEDRISGQGFRTGSPGKEELTKGIARQRLR